jgi:hypothetical protein
MRSGTSLSLPAISIIYCQLRLLTVQFATNTRKMYAHSSPGQSSDNYYFMILYMPLSQHDAQMRIVYNKDKPAVKLLLGLKLLDGEAELKSSGGAAAMLTACSTNDSSASTAAATVAVAVSAKAKPHTWLDVSHFML